MKLRPIQRADAQAATALLREGFPVHSAETWSDSLRRLFAHVGPCADAAIGYIASVGGEDIGIGLAIPARRSAYEDSPREVVNLAAFYMRPGHEWMTTPFLRRMMRDGSVEYVDLTASAAMRAVNRRIGFSDRSRGMVVVPTAVSAVLPGRKARILAVSDAPRGALSPEHQRLLAEHSQLHGIALVVETEDGFHPLILAWSRRKGLWGARVILARDRALIRAALGPLSRHLLRLGLIFLEFDGMSAAGFPGALFVTRFAPVQTTRPSASETIDHTFCELLFIPPPSARPFFAIPKRTGNASFPFPLGLAEIGVSAPAAAGLAICLAETVLA